MPNEFKQLVAGTVTALVIALAAALLPLWPVMECGSWECRFPQGNLPASVASFLLPQNQPEAAHAFSSGLLPSLLGLLAAIMLSFALGYAVARLVAKP